MLRIISLLSALHLYGAKPASGFTDYALDMFHIASICDNKVFDVFNGDIKSGQSMIFSDRHGGANQRFEVIRQSNGDFKIGVADTDYVLDIPYSKMYNNHQLTIYKFHGGDNQLWELVYMGSMEKELPDGAYAEFPMYVFRSKVDKNYVLNYNRQNGKLIIWKEAAARNDKSLYHDNEKFIAYL